MEIDNLLDLKKRKEKKIKLHKIIDLFIRSVLTLSGAIFLVALLMFLNSRFGVSYLKCFVITLIFPSFYSIIVNDCLKGLDKKIRVMEYELFEIDNEYKKIINLLDVNEVTKDSLISNMEFRFDGLSNERKIELLNYIKNAISNNCYFQYMGDIENMESINLDIIGKQTYSRKREK